MITTIIPWLSEHERRRAIGMLQAGLYNITTILELLEHKTSDKYIWIKVAVGLNLGGIDFLPKFYMYIAYLCWWIISLWRHHLSAQYSISRHCHGFTVYLLLEFTVHKTKSSYPPVILHGIVYAIRDLFRYDKCFQFARPTIYST
jgi:hypothetical protein